MPSANIANMWYFRHYNRSLCVPNDKYLCRKYLYLEIWQYWLQTKHDYAHPTRQARIHPKACPARQRGKVRALPRDVVTVILTAI